MLYGCAPLLRAAAHRRHPITPGAPLSLRARCAPPDTPTLYAYCAPPGAPLSLCARFAPPGAPPLAVRPLRPRSRLVRLAVALHRCSSPCRPVYGGFTRAKASTLSAPRRRNGAALFPHRGVSGSRAPRARPARTVCLRTPPMSCLCDGVRLLENWRAPARAKKEAQLKLRLFFALILFTIWAWCAACRISYRESRRASSAQPELL